MDPKSNLILTVSLSLCCVVKYAVFKEVWAGVVAYAFNLGTLRSRRQGEFEVSLAYVTSSRTASQHIFRLV